jgi:effector-binding domain-containing protein
MIYTMKLLGVSLSKIKEYQKEGTPQDLLFMFDSIEVDLDKQIEHLNSIKQIVSHEKYEMKNTLENLNTFKIEYLDELPYIKIEEDVYDDTTFTLALLKLEKATKNFGLHTFYSVGVYGSFNNMNKNKIDNNSINFDGVYMPILNKNNCDVREKGKYLVAYVYTNFAEDELNLFKDIMKYAKENNIELANDFYQESYGGPFAKIENPLFLAKYLFRIKE